MPKPTRLARDRSAHPGCDDSIVFAVYAPLGSDPALSRFPDSTKPQKPIGEQPIVKALEQVAKLGVNVSALIDLYQGDTWLIEMKAGQSTARPVSAWKQDMSQPQALAGWLRRVGAVFPKSRLVLSLEGHGLGYLPDIDYERLTHQTLTDPRPGSKMLARWKLGPEGTEVEDAGPVPLYLDYEILPPSMPGYPASRLPLSTWALAEALRIATTTGECRVQRPVIVNFANCFNASLEHLHAMAPYADWATGYANYDYFTAGLTYVEVFKRVVAASGGAAAADVAAWFAEENGKLLAVRPGYPWTATVVPLAKLRPAATRVHALGSALTAALRTAPGPAARLAVRDAIQACATAALHYDSDQNFVLQVPDQVMDVRAFAGCIRDHAQFAGTPVRTAAVAAFNAFAGLARRHRSGRSRLGPKAMWNFDDASLSLNVFFPDPDLQGRWDWRSPYYLYLPDDGVAPQPVALGGQIPFLRRSVPATPAPWAEFILEYHQEIRFQRFNPVLPLAFPVFDILGKDKVDLPPDDNPPVKAG